MEVNPDLESSISLATLPTHEQFKQLFHQYYPMVIRRVITIVKDQGTADDVAQEVFIKLYHTDWESIDHIPAWLVKTSLHTASNHIRTEKRHQARQEKNLAYMDSTNSTIEDSYIQKEEIHSVRGVLEQINERDQTILLLKYSGYSYEEIAKAISVEPSSIGTLLARAKMRFRHIYNQTKGAKT